MIDKEKAEKLREQGLTYAEIAEALNCSVVWCKKNLSTTPKNVAEKEAVSGLIKRAKSSSAITSGDIVIESRKLHPNNFSKEQMEAEVKHIKRIRDKVKTDKDSVIRPYWLEPTQARGIFYAVLTTLQERDERLLEDINDIRRQFDLDETYVDSLAYALLSMSSKGSKILKRSVVTEINRIEDIVDTLEVRNSSVKPKVKVNKPPHHMDFSDIEEFIY